MPHIPSWSDYQWHSAVHRHVGEDLVYYLVRVRSFYRPDVRDRLLRLLAETGFESFTAFSLFGPTDLLVRAWIHSKHERTLYTDLRQYLGEVRAFHVRTIRHRGRELAEAEHHRDLPTLDDRTIRAVQGGRNQARLSQLLESGLVTDRRPSGKDPIRFYVAITLDRKDSATQTHVATELIKLITTHPTMSTGSVYEGEGFCDLLLKAEAQNFFSIGTLVFDIGERFHNLNPITETYIPTDASALVDISDSISDKTFKACFGESLVARSVIPELYDHASFTGSEYDDDRKTIPRFLDELPVDRLGEPERSFLHDYLLGHLKRAPEVVLFTFFTRLERFLKDTHKEFVGRSGADLGACYRDVKFDPKSKEAEDKPHINIGQLCQLCATVVVDRHGGDDSLRWDWSEFTAVRNVLSHVGTIDRPFSEILTLMLAQREKLQTIIGHVRRVTNRSDQLPYFS